jgi:hypothetical protein
MRANTSRTSADAEFYAGHLSKLLDAGDLWARRRVVSCTVVDGDTLKFHVSVDFDLSECAAGQAYLAAAHGGRWRAERPILLPIGLFRDPLVGFDLRDSGDTRISFIARQETDELTELIREKERANEGASPLSDMLDAERLVIGIVELPAGRDGCGRGSGILHYSYLGRWRKDRNAFAFLPPSKDQEPKRDLRRWSRAWWGRKWMLLGWRPMRVAIPLWNMRYSQGFHMELQTPEGIRIHWPGIFAAGGAEQTEMLGEHPNREVPPCHKCSIVHYRSLKAEYPELADGTLVFRAWLSLDRRFVGVLLFLAVANTMVSAAAVASFAFIRIDMTDVVTVQALLAAAAFAYLYVPGEHGLSRGLYSPVRRASVWIAALGLAVALLLSFLELDYGPLGKHHPGWGAYWVPFVVAAVLVACMILLTLVLLISFIRIKDRRVRKWLHRRRCQYRQFGWHIEG